MGLIGTQTFSMIHGIPAPLRETVNLWRVPGIDGYGAQTLGLGDSEFELLAIAYCSTGGVADGIITACCQMQGTIITIIDDWGNTFPNILLEHVDASGPNTKKAIIFNNSGAACRLELKFKMVATQNI